jgi:hypothetical protein
MSTPDEEVAERILNKLREARLLSENGLNRLKPHLAAGKLKAEDWKFIFETYQPDPEAADANQDQ